ncbi:MAG: hypothetical protein GFH27_549289n87 [Chloroflexi bacterium AL-W]|nr:hypothetical protein [Chloroflexi bacterium AL-N1]NOK66819.1 hypothetical protein [Chloroflexi bacterium AL-N10]NOK74889.1 hypothetical protein [Chloroflexi bacterium AL-N5]NOK81422.1 hypothetical protein [Chloroflexi bacterium AL-W]NOK88891.1 hypothetical protein [Chloroflexi bacterium AL-N15]
MLCVHPKRGPLILFLLLTGMFGYFAWWSMQQTPPDTQGLLFSIGFILFFVVLGILDLLFNEQRIILFENGMRSYYLTPTKSILWQDVETVHFDAGSYNGLVHISINLRYSNGQKYRTGAVLWNSDEHTEEPKPGEIWQIGG